MKEEVLYCKQTDNEEILSNELLDLIKTRMELYTQGYSCSNTDVKFQLSPYLKSTCLDNLKNKLAGYSWISKLSSNVCKLDENDPSSDYVESPVVFKTELLDNDIIHVTSNTQYQRGNGFHVIKEKFE